MFWVTTVLISLSAYKSIVFCENHISIAGSEGNLNDYCIGDTDCHVAYALCQNSSCLCRSGFQPKNGICTFKKLCPTGEPLMEKGAAMACNIQTFFDYQVDSCPASHFCFPYLASVADNGGAIGHCCPQYDIKTKIKAACSAGQPFNETDCHSDKSEGRCPKTYKCLPPKVMDKRSFCCPSPCQGDESPTMVTYEGRCYPQKEKGHGCSVDAQCDNRCSHDSKEARCT